MTNNERIERRITNKVIRALLKGGFAISVNDGEETVLRKSTSIKLINTYLRSTDGDNLYAYRMTGYGPSANPTGVVNLIWGNGEDVISDYSVSLSHYIDPIIAE